jgi:RNA polymerase sigma-70 factor (ECF subfamily)
MVGSFDDAEDLVQETIARAWIKREQFDGSAWFRAWMYRIATKACLDFLRTSRRRAQVALDIAAGAEGTPSWPSLATMPWMQPYPDDLLDASPERAAIERETIELTYLAALQVLPPRQRAVLVLRDVIGWSAAETAEALELSVAAANSALQRARETVRKNRPPDRLAWRRGSSAPDIEANVVQRFMDACERYDVEQMVAIASDGIRMTAPPDPRTWDGREAFAAETAEGFGAGAPGVLRCLSTRSNGRPAVATYLRRWDDTAFRPFVLTVLRIEAELVAEVTSFAVSNFDRYRLPQTLPT